MHSCNSSAIYPSLLPSLPSFLFSSVLLTGGELFHHATDDILLFVKVAEERLLDDCCHLSALFLFNIAFLCDVLIVPTPYELLQEVAFALLPCCSYSHCEYMWWFAKAVLLSDAFHGLSVVFWWLGFSWSILVLAICSYVPKFIVESTSWTLHFDTLWMLLLSINLCVRVCSNHIRDEIDPLFLAITIFSFLHPVPWVPRGEKQWMRTIIVTPAKAKSGIFNLLWLGLGAQFRYLYGAN